MRTLIIRCPKCTSVQLTTQSPNDIKYHRCNYCDHSIVQSEWKEVQNKDVYQLAIEQWGVDAQIEICIEECLELATILQQSKRPDKNIQQQAIFKEIADVHTILEQLKYIYGERNIKDQIVANISALNTKIKAAKHHDNSTH